jgi:hypothetical protein
MEYPCYSLLLVAIYARIFHAIILIGLSAYKNPVKIDFTAAYFPQI